VKLRAVWALFRTKTTGHGTGGILHSTSRSRVHDAVILACKLLRVWRVVNGRNCLKSGGHCQSTE